MQLEPKASRALARLKAHAVLAADDKGDSAGTSKHDPTKEGEERSDRPKDKNWWQNMSPGEQEAYFKKHPNSERVHLYNGDESSKPGPKSEDQKYGSDIKGEGTGPAAETLMTTGEESFRTKCKEFLEQTDKIRAMEGMTLLRKEKDKHGYGPSRARERFEIFRALFNEKYKAGGAGDGYRPSKKDKHSDKYDRHSKYGRDHDEESESETKASRAIARLSSETVNNIWDAEGMHGSYETAPITAAHTYGDHLSEYLTAAGVPHKMDPRSNFAFVQGTPADVTKALAKAGWVLDNKTGHLKCDEHELYVSKNEQGATIVTDLRTS